MAEFQVGQRLQRKDDPTQIGIVKAIYGSYLWTLDDGDNEHPYTSTAEYWEPETIEAPKVGELWAYSPNGTLLWSVVRVTETHWYFVESNEFEFLGSNQIEQSNKVWLYSRPIPETDMKKAKES